MSNQQLLWVYRVCFWVLLVAVTITLWCYPCQSEIAGAYCVVDGYCFICQTCGMIYSDAQWERVGNRKYMELFGEDIVHQVIDCNLVHTEEVDGILEVDCPCGNHLHAEDGCEQFMYKCAGCGKIYTNIKYTATKEYEDVFFGDEI